MANLLSYGRLVGSALLCLCFFWSLAANAETRTLQVTPDGCAASVSVVGANGCDDLQCDGDDACICASKGDHVEWQSPEKFKVKFMSDSPLKDNCGKHFKKDHQKCVVKEDVSSGQEFDYEVVFEHCAEGSDPRIVIK